jgi:hypothetical protein
MQGRITKTGVDALIGDAKAAKATLFLWDDALAGFGAKAMPSGACTYVVQYRLGGRGTPTKRLTLGKHTASSRRSKHATLRRRSSARS